MLLAISTIIIFYSVFFWSAFKLNKSAGHQSLSQVEFSNRMIR
jgi:hypothetical protein